MPVVKDEGASFWGGPGRLRGRRSECALLDELISAVRSGEGRSLVLRGEAGVGKSALLGYAMTKASDLRVLQLVGVESEMELAFAALHQLCTPMLDRLDRLPAPQRDALATVFGLSNAGPPDRFFVGLAVLSLLSELAEEGPLLCVVDDAQWLDRASAQVLGVVARRLMAEPIGVLFATRQSGVELRALQELEVAGLRSDEARALLESAVRFGLDASVRDRLVAETGGNPLALLELPRGLTVAQLAGGFGLLGAQALSGRIEDSFLARIAALPEPTRLLLLVAAAEPVGDPLLVWRAAERLGVGDSAAADAEAEELLVIGDRVAFRHPLVRSAVYRSATPQDRRAVHSALAEVTDARIDADRRAWHLGTAAAGPDERVAAELERSSGRAQARGGLAAAAAFLQRSVALTAELERRAERALTAAQVSLQAGELDAALGLLTTAETGVLDEFQRARADLLRGQIAFASGHGSDAPPLLLKAAKQLEPFHLDLARETYLDAWGAALFAGRLATAGSLLEASRATRALLPAEAPRPSDLLLDGLAQLVTEGRTAAAPMLRRATDAFAAKDLSPADNFRWGWLTTVPSNVLWDDESWHTINARQLQLARAAGALARLPIDLTAHAIQVAWRGDFTEADTVIAEIDAVTDATETRIAPYGAMLLAALRGRQTEATTLITSAAQDAADGGQGIGVQYSQWASSILFNGLGRYPQALAAARQACADTPELFISAWALPELIEAGARSGEQHLAAGALERLVAATAAAGTDWALGLAARSRALLSEGSVAEALYQEAIDRLKRTLLRPELARAHLLYGEWLRRHRRRVDARRQLRTAHELLTAIGMEAFAERARRELLSTGETVRKRRVGTKRDELTPQEKQIALLARDGLSNPEVGARLFLSPRTVEWHLRKVFAKLAISSRRELRDALRGAES